MIIMSERKTNVYIFFDIETLTVNRKAEPKEQKVMEYIVSYKYKYKRHVYEGVKPDLAQFIKMILEKGYPKVTLLAHNGEGYDFAFLRRALIYDFGLVPKNEYIRQSTNHKLESKIKDENANYLHVSRVRSSSRTSLKFRIGKTVFETKDTLPITHMSVRTIGGLLKDLKLDDKGKNVKLNYDDDYAKYDKKEDLSYSELKKYCLDVYNQLNEHAIDYVMNDTRVIYAMFYNYQKIYADSYDPTKLTLSQNILKQYELNRLARFQLINEFTNDQDKYERLELTQYLFERNKGGDYENTFQFIHHFYKGGLNFYNDKYVGKMLNGHIVHIDLNSSYPTVMRYRNFPTFLIDGGVINKKLKLDNRFYYYIQMTKVAFEHLILAKIKSITIREMFVKYLNNNTDCVYIQTPHIMLFEKFIGKSITWLPAIAYLKFKSEPFGGFETIQYNYQKKTSAKKRHASKGEVAGYKVTLNGIYGIPALRPYFPLYEYDEKLNKTVSVKDKQGNFAFKNSERNITFASSVTAWALLQLLTPLTYNIKGVNKSFIYCDTDSIFMFYKYWCSIKDYVDVDPYKLGAWDEEHHDIINMYVLNHKKYCLWSKDHNKVEVFAGGIPIKAFHAEQYKDLQSFVGATFHDGCKIKNLRNAFTKDKVVVLYEAETEINKGFSYRRHFPRNHEEQIKDEMLSNAIRAIAIVEDQRMENDPHNADTALYYETTIGTLSKAELYPPMYDNDIASRLGFKQLLRAHKFIMNQVYNNCDIEILRKKQKEVMKL